MLVIYIQLIVNLIFGPNKNKYSINFRKLNDLISPYNSEGKLFRVEFTTIIKF